MDPWIYFCARRRINMVQRTRAASASILDSRIRKRTTPRLDRDGREIEALGVCVRRSASVESPQGRRVTCGTRFAVRQGAFDVQRNNALRIQRIPLPMLACSMLPRGGGLCSLLLPSPTAHSPRPLSRASTHTHGLGDQPAAHPIRLCLAFLGVDGPKHGRMGNNGMKPRPWPIYKMARRPDLAAATCVCLLSLVA